MVSRFVPPRKQIFIPCPALKKWGPLFTQGLRWPDTGARRRCSDFGSATNRRRRLRPRRARTRRLRALGSTRVLEALRRWSRAEKSEPFPTVSPKAPSPADRARWARSCMELLPIGCADERLENSLLSVDESSSWFCATLASFASMPAPTLLGTSDWIFCPMRARPYASPASGTRRPRRSPSTRCAWPLRARNCATSVHKPWREEVNGTLRATLSVLRRVARWLRSLRASAENDGRVSVDVARASSSQCFFAHHRTVIYDIRSARSETLAPAMKRVGRRNGVGRQRVRTAGNRRNESVVAETANRLGHV